MIRYLRVLLACAMEPWAMEEAKLRQVTQFLLFQAAGGKLSEEERAAKIDRRTENRVAQQQGAIALLPLVGAISQRANLLDDLSTGSGTSTQMFAQQFRAALLDDGVKAIVIDVDSPGGTTSGVGELADEIYNSRGRKPIVAVANSMACSAAYWIATQADEVVVTPGGYAGSVGVYAIHEDISEAMKKAGIKDTYIAAGKYKVEGNETEPLSSEARDHIQSLVDDSYERFTDAVARGRKVAVSVVRGEQFGQGRAYRAKQLIRRKMVDRVETLEQVLLRFGVDVNPVASKNNQQSSARDEVREAAVEKLRAGQPLSQRELEVVFQGTANLSRSEAARAVQAQLGTTQGTGKETEHAEIRKQLDNVRATLDSIRL